MLDTCVDRSVLHFAYYCGTLTDSDSAVTRSADLDSLCSLCTYPISIHACACDWWITNNFLVFFRHSIETKTEGTRIIKREPLFYNFSSFYFAAMYVFLKLFYSLWSCAKMFAGSAISKRRMIQCTEFVAHDRYVHMFLHFCNRKFIPGLA